MGVGCTLVCRCQPTGVEHLIELSHVSQHGENGSQVPALDDVSLTVRPGEFLFLVGPGGAGKTTMVRLLLVLERPSVGRIVVAGEDLSELSAANIVAHRRSIGLVSRDWPLVQSLSVADNVALPLLLQGSNRAEVNKRVNAALELTGLAAQSRQYPPTLNHLEQQRVAIVRALVHQPSLLIVDEPLGGMDNPNAGFMMDMLLEANSRGATVLFATRDSRFVANNRCRTVMLRRGKLLLAAPAQSEV